VFGLYVECWSYATGVVDAMLLVLCRTVDWSYAIAMFLHIDPTFEFLYDGQFMVSAVATALPAEHMDPIF